MKKIYNEIQISWMDIIQRSIREQTKKLVEKWEPTGFLEGIDEENRKHGMGHYWKIKNVS